MPSRSDPREIVFGIAWAGLAVVLMLLGRWMPDHLSGVEGQEGFFWQIKLGALAILAFVLLASLINPATDRRVPGFGLFLVLMIYVLASYAWNENLSPYARDKLADLTFNTALVAIIALGLRNSAWRIAFWGMLLAALGTMALIGLATLAAGLNTEDGRLAVLGGGPNVFGRNMSVLLIVCTYFALNRPRLLMVCIVLGGAGLLGLVSSGSRGALVAWLGGTMVLATIDPIIRRFFLRRWLIITVFVAVVCLVMFFVDLGVVDNIADKRYLHLTLQQGYLSYRDILLREGYDLWLEAPLLGSGLGSFSQVSFLEYPHNIIMEFLCETGILGLVLFLFFAGVSLLPRGLSAGREQAMILSMIALLGIAALFSGDFIDSRFLFLFLLYPVGAKYKVRSRTMSHSGDGRRADREAAKAASVVIAG